MRKNLESAPLSRQTMRDYFTSGCKKKNDLKIGVEWEKIGVYKESAKAIHYSGPRGVESIFKALIKRFSWVPERSGRNIIALSKEGSSITLEPGGQIELSGQKATYLDQNRAELYRHLDEIKQVSDPLGIAWLGIGMQPMSDLPQIQWVPKKRYEIMRRHLKRRGSATHAMMKQTASIQVSMDYISEGDAVSKLRLAMGLTPLLTAMFANSPITNGRLNGYYSKRTDIWAHTAPERSGIIRSIFCEKFSFDDYVDYALSVPLLFLVRDDDWIPVNGLSFGDYIKKGYKTFRPTLDDWELHLTTIFTDVRLKKYIEVRCVDCQKKEFGLSVPALLKGIFYDEAASAQAWNLVKDLTVVERRAFTKQSSKYGIHAKIDGHPVQHMAKNLIKISRLGLGRLTSRKLAKAEEQRYLDPLWQMIDGDKMCPADVLIHCFSKSQTRKEKVRRVLNCAAI